MDPRHPQERRSTRLRQYAGSHVTLIDVNFGHEHHCCPTQAEINERGAFGHLGSHPYCLRKLLQQSWALVAIAITRAWWAVENSRESRPVVFFVCKWGKHRSVGCAALFYAAMRALGYSFNPDFIDVAAKNNFKYDSCGRVACDECDNYDTDQNKQDGCALLVNCVLASRTPTV